MRAAASALFAFGYSLLGVAVVLAVREALRRRDRYRLDLVAFAVLLFLPPLFVTRASAANSPSEAAQLVCIALLPWALLRLVRHFRHVSRAALVTCFAVGLVPALVPILPAGLSRAVRSTSYAYVALHLFLLALILIVEARRSTGVKARRLSIVVSGTALFAASLFVYPFGVWFPTFGLTFWPHIQTLQGLSLACFAVGFGTPRPLLARWRRAEHSAYLAEAMEHEPEERGQRAGDDLFKAAVRGIGGSVTLVALRSTPASSELMVVASSDEALIGTRLTPEIGLVRRALETGHAVSGVPAECETAVSLRLMPRAVNVLVAPVVASGHSWGVVLVGQRRGTLFPEDDLTMLGQVSRNAATALDHAQLVFERREGERKAAAQRLREMESRVELMLDSIKDYAMLALDHEGRVAAWHPGARHVFGYPAEAVKGENAGRLYGMTSVELGGWLAESLAWGHSRRDGQCVRADGSTFAGTTIIRPLVEESDLLPGFVAVTHDVTERRNLEERLRQGQKMEAVGQLAGGVAHDFNNLLTAILGYADWLDHDLAGDQRHEQVVEIQKAAERAAELTRQLLAFSRRQMLQPSAVNVSDLVVDLLPMLRRLIGEPIEILDRTAADLSAVMGDRSQVEQIVVNLAVNARDAMPEGGTLTVSTADVWIDDLAGAGAAGLAPGPYVLLEVVDTGVGMDAVTRQRVFEPFFTTKDVGRGTGLGLSTVYGIVQQMGGAVDVQSEVGQGTTFRLWFPQTSEAVATDNRPALSLVTRRGTETLLLVEDEAAVRKYLAHVLESHGYRVLAAEHPIAALALTESFGERIDLVISDVVMPGSTGPELVRLLGQARPGLSALFISGYADSALAHQAGGVSGHQLLLKPFSPHELLSKIRQILAAA